jgi:hypothetical protein
MIFNITLILVSLIVLNFLLLFFSCNTTKKSQKEIKKTRIINRPITTREVSGQLAPTGS